MNFWLLTWRDGNNLFNWYISRIYILCFRFFKWNFLHSLSIIIGIQFIEFTPLVFFSKSNKLKDNTRTWCSRWTTSTGRSWFTLISGLAMNCYAWTGWFEFGKYRIWIYHVNKSYVSTFHFTKFVSYNHTHVKQKSTLYVYMCAWSAAFNAIDTKWKFASNWHATNVSRIWCKTNYFNSKTDKNWINATLESNYVKWNVKKCVHVCYFRWLFAITTTKLVQKLHANRLELVLPRGPGAPSAPRSPGIPAGPTGPGRPGSPGTPVTPLKNERKFVFF